MLAIPLQRIDGLTPVLHASPTFPTLCLYLQWANALLVVSVEQLLGYDCDAAAQAFHLGYVAVSSCFNVCSSCLTFQEPQQSCHLRWQRVLACVLLSNALMKLHRIPQHKSDKLACTYAGARKQGRWPWRGAPLFPDGRGCNAMGWHLQE